MLTIQDFFNNNSSLLQTAYLNPAVDAHKDDGAWIVKDGDCEQRFNSADEFAEKYVAEVYVLRGENRRFFRRIMADDEKASKQVDVIELANTVCLSIDGENKILGVGTSLVHSAGKYFAFNETEAQQNLQYLPDEDAPVLKSRPVISLVSDSDEVVTTAPNSPRKAAKILQGNFRRDI